MQRLGMGLTKGWWRGAQAAKESKVSMSCQR